MTLPAPRSLLAVVVVTLVVGLGATALLADAPSTEVAPSGRAQGMPAIDRAESRFDGFVTEVLAAKSYRYLRVTDEAGASRWVVTLPLAGRTFSVGERVHVRGFGSRASFTSSTLDRTFDLLTFALVTRAT